MQELITRLTEKAGVTTEQATKALDAIKEFVKEKFPMMAGAVDNLFAQSSTQNTDSSAPPIPSPSMQEEGAPDELLNVAKNSAGGLLGGDIK